MRNLPVFSRIKSEIALDPPDRVIQVTEKLWCVNRLLIIRVVFRGFILGQY